MLRQGFPKPTKTTIEGTLVRLDPLSANVHAEDLFEAGHVPDRDVKFRYLVDIAPDDLSIVRKWAENAEASEDPMFFAVIDQETGKAVGRQSLMRIDATHGVAEIGNIYWGPGMSRSAKATEAMFLMMQYIFEELGYRRLEWKCDNANEPSKAAAKRFGFAFEGLFRQHLIIKGTNRDTAWYSIIDREWPSLKPAFLTWLAPTNFHPDGRQCTALSDLTSVAMNPLR
ncbi:Protein N-acetyltransferase, RimJ/RimL family [Rhizobium sp. 9140]|nr:Protein N-acetyltransferase, RimJ/RimL family [Rhizobium sp. 9140]